MGASGVLAPVYDPLHPRHDLVMRDAGAFGCKPRLNLRPEPGVVSLGFLGRRELGLDGGELGHGRSVSGILDSANHAIDQDF